jgi:D-glycero-alpha-D-manno-heptose-7-phosphate kinase
VKVYATAPTRVDLAGGTVDIWPLYLFHQGAQTLNIAIDLAATCQAQLRSDNLVRLESRDTGEVIEGHLTDLQQQPALELLVRLTAFFYPEGGVEMVTACAAPPGSGLGGSSALNIAVCGALNALSDHNYSREELITIAKNIETQVIRVPAGVQDYYPAMYGGTSAIDLAIAGVRRAALMFDLQLFNEHFLLCNTGKPHFSGTNNWEITKAHIDGDRRVYQLFDRICAITSSMATALRAQDISRVAELLQEEWQVRQELAPGVSTPQIDQLIKVAQSAGALAAKICGAGGGGCLLVLAPAEVKSAVAAALTQAGGQVIPCLATPQGLQVKVRA